MEAIENAAFVSVGRACGFAGLAIFCLVFGLSYDPPFAARAGGLCCLLVTGILVCYAIRAPYRPFKRTEVWLILPKNERPPQASAQVLIGRVLRKTYIWFAKQAGVLAAALLILSLLLCPPLRLA
jgi:hypothetical protein